jgi:hypothetical protein
MFAAKIKHFLCFSNTSDVRAREAATVEYKAEAATACGLSGAPTRVMLPSRRSNSRYELMSCSAETASRMKSKLFMCFLISLVFFEITTSSAPRRSASSFC